MNDSMLKGVVTGLPFLFVSPPLNCKSKIIYYKKQQYIDNR